MSTDAASKQAGSEEPRKQAQVTVEDGDTTRHVSIPAGDTPVPQLKIELGLEADVVLWIRRGSRNEVIDEHEDFDVRSGDHFVVVRGGGVS